MISDLERRIYAAALLLKEKSFRITINKNIQYMLLYLGNKKWNIFIKLVHTEMICRYAYLDTTDAVAKLENILDDSNMNKISLDIKEMINIFALLKEIRINTAQIRGEDYQ